jgi:hypothetical protein
LQKRHFSSQTFSDFFENWHNESFWQKTDIFILFKPQKNYRVTNFSIFHDFSIIFSLITQRVFSAETCAWGRYQRKYDGKIVGNRKVGNPEVFAFWLV